MSKEPGALQPELFRTGYAGMQKVKSDAWCGNAEGPMRVGSGQSAVNGCPISNQAKSPNGDGYGREIESNRLRDDDERIGLRRLMTRKIPQIEWVVW